MLRELGVQNFWPVEPAEPAHEAASVATPAVAPVTGPRPVSPAAAQADVPVSLPGTATRETTRTATAAPPTRPPRAPASANTADGVAAPRVLPAIAADSLALGPRPEGIDTMDWPALRQAVAGCEACGLCRTRKQTVFGVGHPQAQWMLVGEAPGEHEDRQGEPFVGRAGQLLDRMLAALQLTRATDGDARPDQRVYIANTLKCRPPGNRNPQPEEVAQCEPFLQRQVVLVQPRLILAMGRFAVQALLKRTEPIGKLRGRVHDFHGVPLVVTYHPAYLLRNPADKALAWDDLCLARQVLADGISTSGMDKQVP